MEKEITVELIQETFHEFRELLNSFEKQSHLRFGIHKEELDSLQVKLFEKMEPTKFTKSYLKWEPSDDLLLFQMHKLKVPSSKMGEELGRTKMSVIRRLEELKRKTILESLSGFFGELFGEFSDQLNINEEVFSEKINNIFIDKKFESLKQEISKKHYKDEKIEFQIKPEKRKRSRGRPKKDAADKKFDGFVLEAKKRPVEKRPVGRLRKQKTMTEFWAELGNSKTRLEKGVNYARRN